MKCPHCQHPSPMRRKIIRVQPRIEWDCERCGSRLASNKMRGFILCASLVVVSLVAHILLMPYVIRSSSPFIWLSIEALVLLLLFLLACRKWEKLIVLEQQGVYCQACGYDLRGNESGQCPECGESLPLETEAQGY